MYKKLISVLLLTSALDTSALVIGPNLLANSPSGYLADIARSINDVELTQQIGNELFDRDYLTTVSVQQQISAQADNKPVSPGTSYTFAQGLWVWIPTSFNSSSGTWNWILEDISYIVEYIYDHIVHF